MKTAITAGVLALSVWIAWPPSQDGRHLLGRDPAQVLGEYGVPAEVESEPSHLRFVYPGRFGRVWTVIFHDGAVVRVVGKPEPPKAERLVPITGPYLGQSVRELIRRMGMPESHEVEGRDLRLRFPRGPRVTLREGRVIGIED